MDLEVLWQEVRFMVNVCVNKVAGMLEILSVEAGKGANVAVHTHSLFVRHVRLVPFHAVGEGNVDVRMIRQVNGVFVRAGNVNADDIITVVRNVEIQMGVDEMVALRFPVEKQVVLKVADVTPMGSSSKCISK